MYRLVKSVVLPVLAVCFLASHPVAVQSSSNDSRTDCFSDDNMRRITGCTDLLDTPGLRPDERAMAFAMRALAFSLNSRFSEAIRDYDSAIGLNPDFSIALNNRAWALYKSGRAKAGIQDVERALSLSPGSPHALDTRAHIKQEMGDVRAALSDYELAMRFGGERMIKLYQCGLQAQGLFSGDINGLYSQSLRRGLEMCVSTRGCDPLPADEECRKVTS